MNENSRSPLFGRRQLLAGAGGLGLGALARPASAAEAPLATPGYDGFTPSEIEELLAGSCQATPTQTEGPFYLDLGLLRKDISQGEAGVALKVIFRIVRASTCDPIPDAVVDLWCCNWQGRYSGFASQGTAGLNFLRGYQLTDNAGVVRFTAVYPGWYPGRTPHLHVKVHPTSTQEYTTQAYFDDPLTDEIYQLPPYDARGPSPTHNSNDGFYDARNLTQILRAPDPVDGLAAGITISIP